jgi:RNA polymerase sigma factor (sigma-70 family)
LSNESLAELEEKSRRLLEENANTVLRFARFLCRTKQEAEDLALDVCVKILKTQPSKLASTRDVKAYLRTCVQNAHIDNSRAARSRSNRAEVAIPEGDNGKLLGVDDHVERVASRMDVRSAIRELDAEDQKLIYLKYYEDKSIENAVREATGLTGSKAFRRHQAVLDRLRELLAKETD